MKPAVPVLLFLFTLPGVPLTPAARGEDTAPATEPTIDMTSVQITTQRVIAWHDAPKSSRDEKWDVWKWTPRAVFTVNGPVPDGSHFAAEFTLPGGKPWGKVDYDTPSRAPGGWVDLTGGSLPEAKASSLTGVYGFTIRWTNELAGANKPLFSGTFNVKKLHVGNSLPKFKDDFLYYVDQDWNRPIGYVFVPRSEPGRDPDSAPLCASFWFRGNFDTMATPKAYLLYKGQPVASTEVPQASVIQEISDLTTESSPYEWFLYKFVLGLVKAFDKHPEFDAQGTFHLDQNPGEYEIKVLYKGNLVRDAKFRVGDDGKLVENGIAPRSKLNTYRIVLPVKIIGAEDGPWNQEEWKTDAMYGHPLQGFTPPS